MVFFGQVIVVLFDIPTPSSMVLKIDGVLYPVETINVYGNEVKGEVNIEESPFVGGSTHDVRVYINMDPP